MDHGQLERFQSYCALENVAMAIDDFRVASVGIWYGVIGAVDDLVNAAVAELVKYCDVVRDDCDKCLQ